MIARYKLVAEGLIALTLFAAVLYGFNRWNEHQRDIGRQEVRAEWDRTNAATAALSAQLATERERNVNKAVSEGVQRDTVIKNLAAGAAAANASLLDTLKAIRASNNTAAVETLINRANTTGDLLGDCAARYRSVAEKADRHANDARTLSEAWPTK